MHFYKQCLGGELIIQGINESPMADQWPTEAQKHVLHARLLNGSMVLMGSDMTTGRRVQGNATALSLSCSNRKEMEKYFTSLSAGGKVTHPVHEFFNGIIGALTDKYGYDWIFYCDNN